MPASGRPWNRIVAALKADSKAVDAPCWLCEEAIDYALAGRDPRAFSVDHVTATSDGGDSLRRANLKPAHYQRLQQCPRQLITRAVPNIQAVVTANQGATRNGDQAPDLRGGDRSPSEVKTVGPAPTAAQDWSGSD